MCDRKKINLLALTFFINLCALAQSNIDSAANDKHGFMRSEGKIFVVLAIVLTIVAGLLLYALSIDKKISRME